MGGNMSEDSRKIYIVSYSDGSERRNYSTGTKLYERKTNACNRVPTYSNGEGFVVEYELVPTGRKFNKKGELIE